MEHLLGYDGLADRYDERYPDPFQTSLERRAVEAFADSVAALGSPGVVLDVGCGTAHATQVLAARGHEAVGLDPSRQMLRIARQHYPDLRLVHADANLTSLPAGVCPDESAIGILARFSLIHVPPPLVPGVLRSWVRKAAPGCCTLVAFQCTDDRADEVVEFDHAVAPAWRWHPDAMSHALGGAGFRGVWRIVSRPDEHHRFPECHLFAVRA